MTVWRTACWIDGIDKGVNQDDLEWLAYARIGESRDWDLNVKGELP